ncbi:MAG TPA: c-type cytochrome [Candidatus Saccharimonadales bacterium]|nr:c-type cytochrome [Candidatus Saccharimonadales bacterium]
MKRILILLSLLALPGLKAEVVRITLPLETAVFKPGSGAQIANGQCLTCHSADYASMQPPKGLDFWKAEVQKMKDKYGAPIPPEQIDALSAYFAGNYGTGAPAPATMAGTSASASLDAKVLAQKFGCLACHNVAVKVVGPAYKDVAAKYRGRPDAMEKVAHQITHGGSGQWGQIGMPSFDQFTPAQVDALARWVLSQ